MACQNRLLQSLSDLFNAYSQKASNEFSYPPLATTEDISRAELKAQSQWFGAIAALESLLLSLPSQGSGLVLSGPTGILSDSELLSWIKTAIFSPEALKKLLLSPFQLPAAQETSQPSKSRGITELPLFPQDPISREQFCLVFTAQFGLLMVLGEDPQGNRQFHFSFTPELVHSAWLLLRSRLQMIRHPQLSHLDQLIEKIKLSQPDYRLVMEFSRQLLHHLPEITLPSLPKTRYVEPIETEDQVGKNGDQKTADVELLQALTHEIRTPLTTIRTMTQLLLKRGQLTPQMQKCLEVIDQECTEQIERMELIFHAVELEKTPLEKKTVHLVPIALERVFQESIPRWQKQAQRRNIKLEVLIPAKLPQVVSDPTRLDQILGGLMEKVTRNIPSGGEVRVQVSTAGHQLKLQVSSPSNYFNNPFKALGQILMFQPDTGNITLNLNVTKNLFHALGGKFIVRQRSSQQGEIFTVFLPLGNVSPSTVNNDPFSVKSKQ